MKPIIYLPQIIISLSIYFYLLQIIYSCTYSNDNGCDPRCSTTNCNFRWSSLDCCDGCKTYNGVDYFLELNVNKADTLNWIGTASTRCSEYCPAEQYPVPASHTCQMCVRNCTLCIGPTNINCTTCASDNYQLSNLISNASIGAYQCHNSPDKYYANYTFNPCPDGYYGIQNTMMCQTCPTGCTTCNIFLQNLMPGTYSTNKNMGNTPCYVDNLCRYTLRCYSCKTSSGYFLQQGFCYKNECRKYQLYNNTAVSFNQANCYCMDGYYMAGLTCSLCDYSCKTCLNGSTNGCKTCSQGYDLPDGAATGVCIKSNKTLQKQKWGTGNYFTSSNGTFTIMNTTSTPAAAVNISLLPGGVMYSTYTSIYNSSISQKWLFGYSDYLKTSTSMNIIFPSVTLKYSSSSLSNGGHYGVHVKAKFLFVDQWTSTQSIIFRADNKDVYSYDYLMQSVKGEYICGQNYHDHLVVIDFWFAHTSSSLTLEISASATGFSWGIKDMVIEELGCDSSCITCDGPGSQDCKSCNSSIYEVLVDQDCVCDIANKYYLNNGSCSLSCDSNQYMDNTTRSCVSGCVFPLQFNYNKTCYQKCPSAAPFRRWTDSQCLTHCFDSNITINSDNLYEYNGKDKVCYNICPYGTYGDPQTGTCVSKCPSTSSNSNYTDYGYFAEGNFCVETCSSTKFAFPGTRICMASCPAGYYQNSIDYLMGNGQEKLCQEKCSVDLGGSKKYGDNTTKPYKCVDICPNKTFADQASHMCLQVCNKTAYKQLITIANSTTKQGTCRIRCQSSTYQIFGNNLTQFCVDADKCPFGTYGDYLSTYCEIKCTDADKYGNNDTRTCVNYCPIGQFKQRDLKICVKTCPQKNAAGNPEFGDSVTGFCEQHCTGVYFADIQQNRQCKKRCHHTPMQSYGLNNLCVFNCSDTTYGDPFHQYRICTTKCTNNGTVKSYGYNQTRLCVQNCPDTQFAQIISTVPLCVYVCQNNQFGDTQINQCVANCPPPFYGDPTGNRTCNLQCDEVGYFALNLSAEGDDSRVNRTCQLQCIFGWADNETRMCAMTPFDCSEGLYAHQNNHTCVLPIDCEGFADIVTRMCVQNCSQTATKKYFGVRQTHQCVLICPEVPNYFGDNSTDQCEYSCLNSSQVRDIQNQRRCVTNNNCSRLPVAYFGDVAAETCVIALNCTNGTFGDNNTMICQSNCTGPDLHYADPVTQQCVDMCQMGYYALDIPNIDGSVGNVGVCSQTCPHPQYADNVTVTCVIQCSNDTYGVNFTDDTGYNFGTCQTQCPFGQFARDMDNMCVSNCEADHWGQTFTRKCLIDPHDCPQGYYGDNQTHMCVLPGNCSEVGGIQYVAQNISQQCLPGCPDQDVVLNWADMDKFLCVAKCPYNKFGDNHTLTCNDECLYSNGSYNGEYADPQLRICVVVCSAAPIPTYGQNDTYTCVQARFCPTDQWADDQQFDRVCVSKCSDPRINQTFRQMFADNVTKKCVYQCPTYYYGNIVYESDYAMCQSLCPSFDNDTLKFADNSTKLCVKVCPEGYFGDQVDLRCVKVCPDGWYAQNTSIYRDLPDRYCVQTCDNETWAENIKKTCVVDPVDCPTFKDYHWYAYNQTWQCVQTCPQEDDLWGQNSTWICEPVCKNGTFKYTGTFQYTGTFKYTGPFLYTVSRVCIDLCPGSLDDDGLFSDDGACHSQCVTHGYYRDPQNARSCQPNCSSSPTKYYKDDTTMKCVMRCPSYPVYYYAYDDDKSCRLNCPLSTMRDHSSQKCVSSCPNSTFFDTKFDACVQRCPADYSTGQIWYGDKTQTIPLCVLAGNCPANYFADDNVQLCVKNCSNNQWKYSTKCVDFCPDNYFGNSDTGFCVQPIGPPGCPLNHYAQNLTRMCVRQCNGTFADINNKVCVNVCPTTYYADSATRKCSTSCTNNTSISLHKNIDNQTCVSSCAQGLFLNPGNNECKSNCSNSLYQDRTTRVCVSVCPSVPPLYGQNATYTCVSQCLNNTHQYRYQAGRICVRDCPSGYVKNNFTRFCVRECFDNTYKDSLYCVTNCTPKYSIDDPNICTNNCPSPFYKDPTTFKCVLYCPTDPKQYYKVKVVATGELKCSLDCPDGQFRDDLTYSCVSLCPPSPPTYADTTSGNCTSICSLDYYAHLPSRTCKNKCPNGMYADPISRKCVSKCPNGTNTYGDSILAIPKCVSLCSPNTFANPFNLKCESSCVNYPGTYGFDNTTNRICVVSCPYPYVADDNSYLCKLQCLTTHYPYLDKANKSCVAVCTSPMYQYSYMPAGQTINGTCVKFCPDGFFAYLQNNTCLAVCPNGYFGQTDNNTCYQNCTLANNKYGDQVTNLCVDTCKKYNNSYDSFADLYTRECVIICPEDKFTIKDIHTRRCEPRCTQLNEYADWTTGYCVDMCPSDWYADLQTQSCVSNCTLYSERYLYQTNRSCLMECLSVNLFADDQTRKCVPALQCPDGYFGLISKGICIHVCPTDLDLFGDPVSKTCVSSCKNETGGYENYYADSSTRLCVKQCPPVPSLFANNATRRCVAQCPNNTYADNYTRRCIAVCSILPGQTFSDNSTNRCVSVCPTQPNYFSENVTWKCVFLCPSTPKMYADYSTRTCVKYCPGGSINTYADQPSRFCVSLCPNGTFRQNNTRTCQAICKTGYADPKTKYCIAICPPYTYGHVTTNGTKTCKPTCPQQSPMIYAEDGNNLCMTECLVKFKTYRDPSTFRCVKICPLNESMFADNVSRICRTQCPQYFYADYSTRYCVPKCPSVPALFAILNIRVCTLKCPNDTWADNLTRTCVIDRCPSNPDTYGDNSTWTCVLKCPTKPMRWSDDFTRTCVPQCPSSPDYYGDNSTQRCVYNCTLGTFADSTTRMCVETCPQGWFGVNHTRRCELICPNKQFADNLLNLCVAKCSVDPIYYGNPDNHICVDQCPKVNNSFGNPLTQQCVRYQLSGYSGCPNTYFADNISRLCVQVCPLSDDTYGDNLTWKCVDLCPESQKTFADNSTMRCVKKCPSFPEYYAEQYSRRCVPLCLQANETYLGSFSDNSTRMCVEICPQNPNYFSDNSTRRCVFYCPYNPLTFADYSTRRCVQICPSDPDIYGDMSTLTCVGRCPEEEITYADYSTRMCVKVCPTDPWLFADTKQNRCVKKCPNGTFADNSSRICVSVCPQYPESYGDPSTNICVQKCPSKPDIYADQLSQQCVQRCPQGYYAQNGTRKCVPYCPQDKLNYADNYTNRCVQKCPALPLAFATYGDNRTQNCVEQCPQTPFTYADNMTRICLIICNNQTEGGFAQNVTRVCVEKCPDNTYGDITSRYCVRYCPQNWYADDRSNKCEPECAEPYFADPTTWKCVSKCPVIHLLFGQTFNRTCTDHCPETTYADFQSQQCVFRCPSRAQTRNAYDTFGFNDTNECVDQCPIPLYGYPVTYVCVNICPDPYYQNITDHRCYKCPEQCATCNYPQACLTCVENHYLYAGACVQSCPTFPVITYANPNRQCGTSFQCTTGYFALNITKSCVQNCPSGYYKNNQMQTCDACQRGCSTCTNVSYCIVCNNTVAIWYEFKCYTFCSPLRRFYTDTGCVSECLAGTYLSLTTCQVCSSVCKTCVVQAQNCILCADGYYLQNNLCVQKCVTGFKAISQNGSLICKSCSVVNCQVQPLTYEVTQYVEDFQYKFQIKFSQSVDIKGAIQDIIAIKKKSIRRFLVTTFDYLDYTIIDYGGGLYEFVLKNYNPSEGNNQFQMQILSPESIQSASGQLPSTTRSTILIDSANAYTLNDYIKQFTTYTQAIFALSFILLVITFWAYYTIWSPMFDFMQIMFVISIINVDLPPTPVYAFSMLKNSFFIFLPNFFTNALNQPFYDKLIMNNTYYSVLKDFIFLRNMGQIYFILIVAILIVVMAFGCSKKFFNKSVKKWSKKFIKQTFFKKYLFNLINILFLPVFFIAFLNFRSYQVNSGIQGFSIFSSWLFMILFFSIIGYMCFKIRQMVTQSLITYLMIQKAYNFISYQEVVLINNDENYFVYQKNEVDLKKGRQPRINDNLILPFELQTKFNPLQLSAPLFNLLYKFLIAIFIAIAYKNAAIQIFFCLLATIIYGGYFIMKKPFIRIGWKQFNNEITIHNLVVICLMLILLFIFKIQMTELTMADKNIMGLGITLLLIYGITVNIVYFIYRTYNFYFETVWKPFVRSEMFKDNYTVEHLQLTKKYDDNEQLLKKKLRSRSEFLQTIKVQKGQALANMVLRDPNHSKIEDKFKSVKLRPDKNQIIKKDITDMFNTMHNQHEKSNKSLRSSERLSKFEREKVRSKIFEEVETKIQDKYEHIRIIEENNEEAASELSNRQNDLQVENKSESGSEYSFQFFEEEYPEETPVDEILRNCKKGEVVMP